MLHVEEMHHRTVRRHVEVVGPAVDELHLLVQGPATLKVMLRRAAGRVARAPKDLNRAIVLTVVTGVALRRRRIGLLSHRRRDAATSSFSCELFRANFV